MDLRVVRRGTIVEGEDQRPAEPRTAVAEHVLDSIAEAFISAVLMARGHSLTTRMGRDPVGVLVRTVGTIADASAARSRTSVGRDISGRRVDAAAQNPLRFGASTLPGKKA